MSCALIHTVISGLIVLSLASGTCARNNLWTDQILLWEKTVQQGSRKARSYNFLGLAYRAGNRTDLAVQAFLTALSFDPEHADARNNLGDCYVRMGRIDDAQVQFEILLQLAPRNPKYGYAHFMLGEIYLEKGRLDDAAREFQILLNLKPASAYALNDLGVVYLKQKRFVNAVRAFEAALQVSPQYAKARENLETAQKLQRRQ